MCKFSSPLEFPDFLPAVKQQTSSSLWGAAEFITEDSNYFSLSMKQTDKVSTDKFKNWWVNSVPPQRKLLFSRQHAVDCIISNCQALSLKANWLNVQFLRLFCVCQSTERLHVFSANLPSRSTAFEQLGKFSTVIKIHKPIVSLRKSTCSLHSVFGNSFLQANLSTLHHLTKRGAQFY